MADKYKYKSGGKVEVAEGEDGIHIRTPGGRSTNLKSVPAEGKFHAQFEVQPLEIDPIPVASRHNGENKKDFSTVQRVAKVEFICFGHVHIYDLDDYPKVAPQWRERLLAEARILARSLQGDQAIAYEFLEADGSLGAWLSTGIAAAIDWFASRPIPDPKKYDDLMRRVWQVSDSLKACTPADYEILHAAGLEFMHIRDEQNVLNKDVQKRIKELIDAAQIGQKGSEEIEGAAFWVLDLYGQVVAKEPASLFAYRFFIMTVRAGARTAGSLIADNSARAALQELFGVVRKDLPAAATGLVLGLFKKGASGADGPMETFAQQLISLQLFVLFQAIDFYVFEVDQLPREQKANPGDAFLDRLAEPLAEQIVSGIGAVIVSRQVRGLPPDSPIRKRMEQMGAIIPVLLNSTMREIVEMKKHASEEHRPFSDVFTSEGGWAIVRILRDVAKAAVEAAMKSAMTTAHRNDRAYYTGLILSLKLTLAPVDPSRVKSSPDRPPIHGERSASPPVPAIKPPAVPAPWNKSVPRTKSGPDSDGNIGIGKLKPISGTPTAPNRTTPPKPDRTRRKKVVTTPPGNRVAGAKSENLGKIGPQADWKAIEKGIKAGQISREAYVLQVIVRDPKGKVLRKWYEVSEPGTERTGSLAQTEQKALARAQEMNLEPGSVVILAGHQHATRNALRAAAKSRAQTFRTQGKTARNVVVTVVMDSKTGAMFYGSNHEGPPSDLHPILRERLRRYHQEYPTEEDWLHHSVPGSHSEIYALNQALKAREAGPPKTTISENDLHEFVMDNVWTKSGNPVGCCPNCTALTQDVESFSDKRERDEPRTRKPN